MQRVGMKTTLQSYGINKSARHVENSTNSQVFGKIKNHDGEITGTLQKDREIKARESVRDMREAGGATMFHTNFE